VQQLAGMCRPGNSCANSLTATRRDAALLRVQLEAALEQGRLLLLSLQERGSGSAQLDGTRSAFRPSAALQLLATLPPVVGDPPRASPAQLPRQMRRCLTSEVVSAALHAGSSVSGGSAGLDRPSPELPSAGPTLDAMCMGALFGDSAMQPSTPPHAAAATDEGVWQEPGVGAGLRAGASPQSAADQGDQRAATPFGPDRRSGATDASPRSSWASGRLRASAASKHPVFGIARRRLGELLDWLLLQEAAATCAQLERALRDVSFLQQGLEQSRALPCASLALLTELTAGQVRITITTSCQCSAARLPLTPPTVCRRCLRGGVRGLIRMTCRGRCRRASMQRPCVPRRQRCRRQ